MNLFALAAMINLITGLFFGIAVLVKNLRKRTNVIFSLFAFTSTLWSFGYFFWQISDNYDDALFWCRILMVGASFITVTYLHFIFVLLGLEVKKKKFLLFSYLLFIIFGVLNATPLMVATVKPLLVFKYWPIAGVVFNVFLPIWLSYAVYSVLIIFKAFRKSSGLIKAQLRYILIGTIIGYLGGLTNYFLWYGILILPFGNISYSLYLFIVAYAIMRYRFMDMRQVARFLLIYFVDAIIVFLFFNLLVLIYLYFWGSVWHPYSLLTGVFIAPIFVYSLFSLNQLFIRLIDKYFFYSLYDYRQTIIKLTSELNNYNDLNKIIDLIVDTIKKTMGLNRAGVLLINKEGNEVHYKIYKVIGFDITNGISLVKDNFLTRYLKKTAKPLVREEMGFIANNSINPAEKKSFLSLEKEMEHIEASLCLPLLSNKKLKGIIVLGAKNSGDPFTKEDLELLSTLSNQAAIAIDNARLYSETKNFNKVLQQKVDEQTSELKERAAHLEKLLKMREEFLDIASHQLKTPVSVIRSTISMFRDGSMDKLPKEQQQKFLDSIFFKTEKLNVIISDILRASEIETEEFSIDSASATPVKLEDLLKSVHDDLLPLAKAKNLSFELVLPAKAVKPVLTSGDFLEQALYNLADNAIKYTDKGYVRMTLRDQVGGVEIVVADTGIGIPEADKKKMFEKFSRAKNAVNMYTDGSGLGLFIAKQIIEAHRGAKLSFTSEEGKGTTFTAKFK